MVEGKNGAIIRKHLGYGHIPAEHAEAVQKFYTAEFNSYLNVHRPCGFATVSPDSRGKRRRQVQSWGGNSASASCWESRKSMLRQCSIAGRNSTL